ncbi:DEAD/DEAH box helicase family protein [Runella sp. CRIBMP]|uniref:DEAD/DEAH box helicase family protein n=1 Tax=Runella sp. CRIBMP TaxID=2683261 RepID=UPI00141322BC|nr:DEAD/DEAH box helicase family protein [Runella sp. CRIBMP]NBB23299.1 DEAD/DEAH box helicase family protein [Runella sp. CRIBMP]
MLHQIIFQKKKEWLKSNDCGVKDLVQYIRTKGELRDTQTEAIETYLFLKIKGQNKPLWQLFTEGFFSEPVDLEQLPLSTKVRNYLNSNDIAKALYSFSIQKIDRNGTLQLPEVKKAIELHPEDIDYAQVIKDFFYGVDYTDYLFSLPMGAGKTFLMAAFIYLDLYFAQNEPQNPHFAHNFLILIPSGLKTSIIPSLKSIERFDPAWVIPEPAASNLKRLIRFEVLDQPKTAKKSNKVQNPNAQKVNQYVNTPDLMGLILVVNAEKIILDRLEIKNQLEVIERTEDEKDKSANELRNLIGRIPNLSIHIDEVHHAASDDIKLRQVVAKWNRNGTVTSVLGYSGTPYLPTPERINVGGGLQIRFSQITNTVYYYRLVTAIQRFLKKPDIKIGGGRQQPLQILDEGVKMFYEQYGQKVYANGTTAKLAIYCSSIPRLETVIYPYLVWTLGIPQSEILKYHGGNKEFKIEQGAELDYLSLDLPISKKKIVLLVQIGKEGWDCRSLTGVILAQTGDCPKNMVLQTACRCLRQVDKNAKETALIWLNQENATTLNEQLREEQQTSIQEINSLGKQSTKAVMVERSSRLNHLNLPKVDFYQLQVKYNTVVEEKSRDVKVSLTDIYQNLENWKSSTFTETATILDDGNTYHIETQSKTFLTETGQFSAHFQTWLLEIVKGSCNTLQVNDLTPFKSDLLSIFEKITYLKYGQRFFNELYPIGKINAQIRLVFAPKRTLQTDIETIEKEVELLLIDKLRAVEKNDKLYPDESITQKIKDFDEKNTDPAQLERQVAEMNAKIKEMMVQMGNADLFSMAQIPQNESLPLPVKVKNRTFHYLPYNFEQSGFEKLFLERTLQMSSFQDKPIEIYYNGERGLTRFEIECYEQLPDTWKRLGYYTPDFLILRRKSDQSIEKVLIVETKGEGYKTAFEAKKRFMNNHFVRENNQKFGYERFDFLYLQDDDRQYEDKLNQKLNTFFH